MNPSKLYLTPDNVVSDAKNGYKVIAASIYNDRDTGKDVITVEAVSRGYSTVKIKLDNTAAIKDEVDQIIKDLDKQSKNGHEGMILVDLDEVAFKVWVVNGTAGVSGTASGIHRHSDIVTTPFESTASKTKP